MRNELSDLDETTQKYRSRY